MISSFTRTVINAKDFIKVGEFNDLIFSISKYQTRNPTNLQGDEVITTPRLVQQIENSCSSLLEKRLNPQDTSVGYYVEVYHENPGMLGDVLKIHSVVEAVDKNKVTFRSIVQSLPDMKEIGKAVHIRAAIPR